jgi:ectoine hydroxylase-related dioxygenase (phytanoyl-CoA dioxygenase family)
MIASGAALSTDEVTQFHRRGYLGPYRLRSAEEMSEVRSHIDTRVLPADGPNPRSTSQCRHLDDPSIHGLLSDPGIIGRLRSLIGDDIVLWASYFFNKEPGGAEIPWHQDANFWPIEPPLNISIWLAIDEVTVQNSCVQIIPESHREVVRHRPAGPEMAFSQEADPAFFDPAAAVDMTLEPGEFFIFNERLLHHSHANSSPHRRLGLSARYTVPFVKIMDQEAAPLFPGHRCVVVSGEDRMLLNRSAAPPLA